MDHDAREQISFIKQVITDSMGILSENGAYYILWGSIVVSGTLSTYLAVRSGLSGLVIWIWIVVYVAGILGTVLLNARAGGGRPKTLARRVYVAIWTSAGISGAVFALGSIITGKIPLEAGMALLAGLLGTAYFINSRLNRNRWMFILSFCWWSGSASLFFVPANESLLVMSAMVLFFELIPGIIISLKKTVPRPASD